MKMTAFVAALLVAVAASSVFAGEPSRSSLNKMGLSGVAKMTDAQGLQVRGMGSFAAVGGFSFASIPGSAAGNFYLGGTSSNHSASSSALGGSSSAASLSLLGHTVISATAGGSSFVVTH